MAEQDDDVFEITASKTEGSFDADDKTIDESIDGQDGVSYFKYLILFIHLYILYIEINALIGIIKDGIWIICI